MAAIVPVYGHLHKWEPAGRRVAVTEAVLCEYFTAQHRFSALHDGGSSLCVHECAEVR